MNKLRKVGLTALAGSLVAVSANAVDLSVTGTSKLTYTTTGGTKANTVTGNPWGSANAVAMTGSGDVGWATVTIKRTIGDNFFNDADDANDSSSAWQKMDMGDMGQLAFDSNGGGLVGLGAYDDLLPSAYEEMWNGLGTGSAGTSSVGSNNVWSYQNTFMDMVTVGIAHAAGGNGGTADNASSGSGVTAKITDMVLQVKPIDGLTISGGRSISDNHANTQPDTESHSVNIVYASGPFTIGYRAGTKRDGQADGGTTGTDLSIEAYAVSFNVNDELSVSYGEQDITHHKSTGTADVEETAESINVSYTMGAMTIAAQHGDASNASGTSALDDENTIIAMTLAF